VKKAFREISKTSHPDKFPASEKESAEERFRLIQEAYDIEILKNLEDLEDLEKS